MFADSAQGELVAILLLHSLAKLLELCAGPLELMVPMPHLSLLKLKKGIELFVGSGDEAQLWFQVAEDILSDFGDVFRRKVLYQLNHSDHLRIFLFYLRVFLGGVTAVYE